MSQNRRATESQRRIEVMGKRIDDASLCLVKLPSH
jgi:hypothetical protein